MYFLSSPAIQVVIPPHLPSHCVTFESTIQYVFSILTYRSNNASSNPYRYWIELHLFNEHTRPAGHISHPTQVGSLRAYNLDQSYQTTQLLVNIPISKSRQSSTRGSSKNQLCIIHPEFPAKLLTPNSMWPMINVCPQWW